MPELSKHAQRMLLGQRIVAKYRDGTLRLSNKITISGDAIKEIVIPVSKKKTN